MENVLCRSNLELIESQGIKQCWRFCTSTTVGGVDISKPSCASQVTLNLRRKVGPFTGPVSLLMTPSSFVCALRTRRPTSEQRRASLLSPEIARCAHRCGNTLARARAPCHGWPSLSHSREVGKVSSPVVVESEAGAPLVLAKPWPKVCAHRIDNKANASDGAAEVAVTELSKSGREEVDPIGRVTFSTVAGGRYNLTRC